MFEFPVRFGRAFLVAAVLIAGDASAQTFPADGCLPRREAIAAVKSGKVVPLRQVRGTAEEAARGEMINAELCVRGGATVYVLTVLSTSGKVVYVTLDGASGRLIGTR